MPPEARTVTSTVSLYCVPFLSVRVTVMVVSPSRRQVTLPKLSTLATVGSLDVQVLA